MVTKTATVTHNYTYANVLANSKKVAWTEDHVLSDIDALETATARVFSEAERDEITAETLKAQRYTLLVAGLEHPNVVKLVEEIMVEGSAKIGAVAEALSA